MLSIKQLQAIDPPWTTMEPVRLGSVPSGLGTADLFVIISDEDRPILRVDLYGDSSSETFTFQDRFIWCGHVFVGHGHRVYVIDPEKKSGSEVSLTKGCGYFGAFYSGTNYLLVATAECLIRLSPDGRVQWKTPNLGLDGVVVTSVENGKIHGEGEWNPPGAWKPFAMRLDSGELITS